MAKCTSWGTGSDPSDHCHATSKDPNWLALRAKRQAAQAASRAPLAPAPVAPPAYHGGYAGPPAPAPVLLGPHVPRPAERTSLPTTLVALPDPTSLGAEMVELGTLELPVRAGKGRTLAAVAARLLPHGGVLPYSPASAYRSTANMLDPDSGQLYVHENLMAMRSTSTGAIQTYSHLVATSRECGYDSDCDEEDTSTDSGAVEANKAVVTDYTAVNLMLRRRPRREGIPPPSRNVTHRIILVDATGTQAPTEHALPFSRTSKNSDLVASVTALLLASGAAGAAPPAGTAFAVVEYDNGTPADSGIRPKWVVGMKVGRGLPNATHPHLLTRIHEWGGNSEVLATKMTARDKRPRYLVYNGLPCGPSPLGGLALPHCFVVVWLRHREMHVTHHKHRRGRMAYTSSHLTRTVFGIPFLVALPDGVDPYAGGPLFVKAIQDGLRACVAHAVVEGAAYEEPLLTRCGPSGNYSDSKWTIEDDQFMFMCPDFQRSHADGMSENCTALVDEQGNYQGKHKDEEEGGSGSDMDASDDDGCGLGLTPNGLTGDALKQLRGAELLLTHKVPASQPRVVFVAATWAKGKVDTMFTPDLAARKFALAPTAEADGDGDARARQQAAESSQRVEDQMALWRELKGATQVSWHHTPATGNASAPAGYYRPGYYYQNTPTLRYTLSLVPDAGSGDTGVLAVRLFGIRTLRPSIYAPAAVPGPPCEYIFGEGSNVSNIGRIMDALWRTKSAPFRKNELDADAIRRECADRADVCTLPGLLAACVTGDKPEAPQPAGLAVSLRPYQKQALQFCVQNETEEHIPQLFWTSGQLADGTAAWYSTAQKRLLLAPPAQPKGGFMCLDMGLGKTVCTLALILAQPESPAAEAAVKADIAASGLGLHHSSATLVVCAVSLVGQWIAEAKSKLSDDSSLRIHMYHGTGRDKNTARLARDYDLVVTTYETMGSDFGKDNAKHNPHKLFPPLGAIHWHRVILDESHSIGSPGVNKSLACLRLHASRRWCVTGTPCGNSIGELQGQLAFLRAHPWTENGFFSSQASHVFGNTGNRYGGSPDLLLYTLRRLMVRHTKTQTLGGKAVLELPPKTEVTIPVELTAEERKVYDKCLADAKGQFTRILARGPAAVSQQLLAIMSLLLPLRRICSGGALLPKDIAVPDLEAAEQARQAARLADLQAKAAAAAAAAAAWGYGVGAAYPGGGGYAAGYAIGDVDEKKPHLSGPPPGAAGPSGAAAAPPAPAAPDSPVDAKPVLAMTPDDDEMCCQCGELCEEPVRTGCLHWFCKECFLECMPTSARASAAKCPKCSKPVSAAALMDDAAADAGADTADDTNAGAGPGAAAGPSTAKGAAPTAAKGKAKAKAPKRKRKASSEEEESEEEWVSDSDSDTDAGVKAKAAAAKGKGKDAAAAAPPKPAAGGGKTRAAKVPVGPLALLSESKLQALLKELTKMRAEDESHKALVFSQFIGTLEWLKSRLPDEGFGYRTISGSMPLNQRAKAIAAFQEDPPTTVFLLSVRSGAVGINLTSASHVFVMEPLLNPALEAQAIGRAWRMGQTRSVKVVHFVTKDTVETRIVELNATRAQAKGAQGGGAAAQELANRKGKVRITEIAGAIRADKQDLRAEELQLLFS